MLMLLWLGISHTTINSEYVFEKQKKEGIVGLLDLNSNVCFMPWISKIYKPIR